MGVAITYNIQKFDYDLLKKDGSVMLVYPSTVYWSGIIRSLHSDCANYDKQSARWMRIFKEGELIFTIPDPAGTPAKSEFTTADVVKVGHAIDPEHQDYPRWIYYLKLKYRTSKDFDIKHLKK